MMQYATNERDLQQYGDVDMEALAAQVMAEHERNQASMAIQIMDMMSGAQEDILLDPSAAHQMLNRAKFLILRCCPMLNTPPTLNNVV